MLAKVRARLGKAAKEEKGFTLIELLAVIVILGIIAVIAVPMIGNLIGDTKEDADLATARQIYDASRIYVVNELSGQAGTVEISVIGNKKTSSAEATGLQGLGYIEDGLMLPSNKKPITGGIVYYASGVLADKVMVAASGATPATTAAVSVQTEDGTKYYTKSQIMKTELK